MKTGVIHPSIMDQATFAADVGGWDASYGMQNMADLVRPSKIARATGDGIHNFIVDFPTEQSVRAIAIIGHNAALTSTLQVSVHHDAGASGNVVWDSGSVPFYPSGVKVSGYRHIRPFILPANASGQSVYIRMSANDVPYEIQAVEIGDFWEWPGISYGRELGVLQDGSEIPLLGGASYRSESPRPRRVAGLIDYMKMAETTTTGLDFQKRVDIQKPFVWAEDYDDSSTWPRKCLLVRNQELPPMAGALYRHDRFPIQLVEHLR